MKNFLNSEKDFRFNEILFENRNKNYGAYVLRNSEANLLTKSLFIGVALFTAVAVSPLIVNSFRKTVVSNDGSEGFIFTPVELPPDKIPVVVKQAVSPKVIENTAKSEDPTPTRNAFKETRATPVSAIGNVRTDTGTPVANPSGTTASPQIADRTVQADPQPLKPVNDDPVSQVDVEASFGGGINAFRAKVVSNFNAENFEGAGGLIKTTVTFIVEKNGTITGVTAKGPDSKFNKEAETTIKNIKGKWMPAKLNGEAVRSYFNFPISMQFD